MPKLKGFSELIAQLKRIARQAADADAAVIVGYTQVYSMWVHEDMEARHAEGKQAKYLEDPAKRLMGHYAARVKAMYLRYGSMMKALIHIGLELQRESQEIVPVDTGALRASAFTAPEDEADEAARMAFARSESIRTAALKGRKLN